MEFYSLACQSGQFTLKLPTVWIQIPLLMLSDDVLLEEDKLCWWDLTMVEILWKPRESYVKLFATGIKARFTTFFWQETSSGFQSSCPVISWGCLGVMHSFCAEGDESSHEGRAFRWRGFADSNLWSRSDYQRRCGQLSSFCQRKHGPIHQRLLPTMASTVNPLEASSVGLRFVSTYFHWVGEDCSLISDTRFATNVWYVVYYVDMFL